MVALDDSECQERLEAVQNQARELYPRDGHQRWARRSMSGADYLRLQILIALEALHTRLSLLESLRKMRSPTLEKRGHVRAREVALLRHVPCSAGACA